jgi:hypothetical protein
MSPTFTTKFISKQVLFIGSISEIKTMLDIVAINIIIIFFKFLLDGSKRYESFFRNFFPNNDNAL